MKQSLCLSRRLHPCFFSLFAFFFYLQGERSFFLLPGEQLEKGIQNVYILGEDEGLILRANEAFKDGVNT